MKKCLYNVVLMVDTNSPLVAVYSALIDPQIAGSAQMYVFPCFEVDYEDQHYLTIVLAPPSNFPCLRVSLPRSLVFLIANGQSTKQAIGFSQSISDSISRELS